jgi:hypothetical protein
MPRTPPLRPPLPRRSRVRRRRPRRRRGNGRRRGGRGYRDRRSRPAAEDRSATYWAREPGESGPRGLLAPGIEAQVLAPEVKPRNVQTFFAVYFGMTGLHGIHVIAGMGVIAWLLVLAAMGRFSPAYYTPVHLGGLYWHLVDLIWIYLFPLLYLIH